MAVFSPVSESHKASLIPLKTSIVLVFMDAVNVG